MVNKLVALAQGNPSNSRGSDVVDTVNGLIDLNKSNPIWESHVDFTIGGLKDSILLLELYGADNTKRYGFEIIRCDDNPNSRSFIGLREINSDNSNGPRVSLWDDTSFTVPAAQNGKRVSDLYIPEANGSGVSARIIIDWAALLAQTTWYNSGSKLWYTNAFTHTDAEIAFSARKVGTPPLNGQNQISFQVSGNNARVHTSAGYASDGEPDTLLLLMHGNGGDYTYKPPTDFYNYCRDNKITIACIQGQDITGSPYTTSASGWGNKEHYNRQIALYEYVRANFNVHDSVIIAGQSMGGLAMGQLAYNRPFPIRFCLGVGPVPSLRYIFDNSSRKAIIRNSHGLATDGSEDSQLDAAIQGRDWFAMGSHDRGDGTIIKQGFPRMYLYLGTGDSTATNEFGGIAKYEEIRDAIHRAGGHCVTKDVGAIPHADNGIYTHFLNDGVMDTEMNL